MTSLATSKMNRDTHNSDSDDALEQYIREAMRVDVDPLELTRLERFWNIQSQRQKWRRNAWRAIASAAAAAAVLAAAMLARPRAQDRQSTAVIQGAPRQLATIKIEKPSLSKATESVEQPAMAGREPTAFEQFVFAARSGVNVQNTAKSKTIDDAIQRVVSTPDANPAKVIEALRLDHADIEAQLLRRLSSTSVNERQTILRLLASCGSPRSAPVLLRLAKTASLRDESLTTLEQIVGIDGLASFVRHSTAPDVRSALIHRLLGGDSQAGLLAYLSLVQNEATRAEALAVAKDEPNAPVPKLIALLDHGEERVRISAAITLGHINGPETTRLLIDRITEQPANSREAWFALMACRDEMARDFLDYAKRRPQLLGYYNYAHIRFSQMIQ
jgi:hypothetical protein